LSIIREAPAETAYFGADPRICGARQAL